MMLKAFILSCLIPYVLRLGFVTYEFYGVRSPGGLAVSVHRLYGWSWFSDTPRVAEREYVLPRPKRLFA